MHQWNRSRSGVIYMRHFQQITARSWFDLRAAFGRGAQYIVIIKCCNSGRLDKMTKWQDHPQYKFRIPVNSLLNTWIVTPNPEVQMVINRLSWPPHQTISLVKSVPQLAGPRKSHVMGGALIQFCGSICPRFEYSVWPLDIDAIVEPGDADGECGYEIGELPCIVIAGERVGIESGIWILICSCFWAWNWPRAWR